jgi:predicted PurR-regulated permease PerM
MNAARPSVLWLATLAAVVVIIVLLRDILLPFVAGIALAYLLDPVVERIERLGVNRTVAALGIVGLFIIGVVGVLVLVTPLLGTEIANFMNLDGTPDGARCQRVFVVIEAHQASLRHRRLHRVESVEPAGLGTSFGRSASHTSQIVWSVGSGWRCALAEAMHWSSSRAFGSSRRCLPTKIVSTAVFMLS